MLKNKNTHVENRKKTFYIHEMAFGEMLKLQKGAT